MSLITLNKEQKLILNEIRKFSQTELEPLAEDIDRKDAFPADIIKKLNNLGLSGIIVPEQYGGAALDTTSLCIVLEELARASAAVSTILFVNNCLVAYPLMHCAPEEKKKHYLAQLCDGTIAGYCVEAGIDAQKKSLHVSGSETEHVLSGTHDFVLNGEAAQFVILPITLSGDMELHVIDVASQAKPVKQHIMGLRGAGVAGLEFTDVVLNAATRLTSVAAETTSSFCDYARIGFAAISLGCAEAAHDASIKYSKERKQFGRAICEFPMVQEMIVDMNTNIEAARFLVYDAAARADKGDAFSSAALSARLMSANTAVFCGIEAVQVHGGYGYIKDYPVERNLRDAKTLQLITDTPQDLKIAIAKELLK